MAGYQTKLKTFSQRPYYDDYDISKKFLQILYRPGMAVQARELTQMQTIMQDQIARMGSHFFDNGAKIIGGETSVKSRIEYIKLSDTYFTNLDLPSTDTHDFIGGTVTNGNLTAKITHFVEKTTTDPATIYVEYLSSDGHVQSFASSAVQRINVDNGGTGYNASTTITLNGVGSGATATATVVSGVITSIDVVNGGSGYTTSPSVIIGGVGTGASATALLVNASLTFSLLNKSTGIYDTFTITNLDQTGIGYGALAFVNDGIYFINGRFAIVDKQTLVVSKYSDITTTDNQISLGFMVSDLIITPEDDSSLYDNAIGSPNESAPGATRYVMSLEFAIKPSDDSIKNFVQLMVLQSGNASTPQNTTDYSQLFLDIFARRTYDESGDYVINDFSLDLKEHLNNGTNLGQYTLANGGDSNKMVAIMGPGKAYVRGYEVNQLVESSPLVIDKSRDVNAVNDIYISNPYENYVYVDLDTAGTTPAGSTTDYPFDLFNRSNVIEFRSATNTVLYTVQPMGMSRFSGTIYKLYFTQLKNIVNTATFSQVNYIAQSGKYAPLAVLSGTPSVVVNQANSSLILDIPYSYVKNMFGALQQPYKKYVGTVAGDKINLNDNTIQFVSDTSAYVVCIDGVGYITPTSLFKQQGVVEIEVPIAYDTLGFTVWTSVAKNTYTPKTKTVQTVVDELHSCFSPSDIANVKLNNTDIIQITSISIDDGNGYIDYTSRYDLDNGQRDDIYDYGYAKLKKGISAPTQGTVKISYTYFSHSVAGDYFTVDSYSTIAYDDIPKYNGRFLGNVIDLRTSINQEITKITPSTDIIIDYTYYLSRYDNIILNSKGIFSVIRGVPSLSPKVPLDSDDSITLYTLKVPAYTFKSSDVSVDKKDYKRYTMRDIANIDKRVQNLEYYTQLSMLETDIQGKEYFDKFKSGFVVDNFESLTTGDVDNPLHTVAIDFTKGEMCVETVTSHVNLEVNQSSNTVINDEIITLPYTEVPHVSQLLASTIVRLQPFAQYSWNGKVKLTPNVDRWVSYQYAPDLTLDGGTFPAGTSANTIQNKVWDLAAQAFVGQESSIQRGQTTSSTVDTGFRRVTLGEAIRDGGWNGGNWSASTLTTTTTQVGTKVVGIGAIPWIRSRWVQFTITGLKPNTIVKPYFDGIDVSKYCYQTTGSYPTWNYWNYWYFWSGNNSSLWETLMSNTQTLKSNGAGVINGWFLIPNNETLRFKTGVRKFTVSDAVENPSTTGIGTYDASGTSVTLQNVFVTTRVVGSRRFWSDPIAQSFVFENPEGAFVSSIDLYFGPEASSVPDYVTVLVCDMVNGYPGQNIVASKEVYVNNGSADATVATRFTFDSPFYLESNKEYAFIVESNSEDLSVWCSELGQKSVRAGDTNTFTGEYINKQPYLGSMFKSQNHTTWTAEQTQDMKFVINRAKFDYSSTGTVTFTNKLLDSDIDTEANIFKKLLEDNPMSVQYGPNLTIKDGGSGYSNATFAFSGGGGSGFAATAVIRGEVDSVSVTNGGSGYTTATASIVGDGSGATILVTVSGGAVTGITVVSGGDGYDPNTTTVQITGDGTGATATPTVYGSISGFSITNYGTGYTSAPTLVITGDGTGADIVVDYNDGSFVTVRHKNHGFKVGDTVVITYPSEPSYNGGNNIILGDFTIADISGSHVITSETIDTYTFAVTSATNTKTVQNGGGTQVIATQVIPYSLARLNTDAIVLNGTTLNWSMKAKGYYSNLIVDNISYGLIEDKLVDFGTLKVVKSDNDKSIQLTAELSTTNDFISPVVDISKVGLYVVSKRINELNDSYVLDNNDLTYEVNNSIARYATKNITIVNPSNELQVYLDNNLLSGTQIDVYCKVSTTPTSVSSDNIEWKKMNVVSGNEYNNIDQFTETKYVYESDIDFTNFVVKVVYSSTIQSGDDRYRSVSPRSKRFRAIALKD